jgi:hypothetical protein
VHNIDFKAAEHRLEAKARTVPEALACRVLATSIDVLRLRQDLKALLAALNGVEAEDSSPPTWSKAK